MNSTKLHLALGITGLAMTAGAVNAATVLIDWSTANDLASFGADANGNFWNTLGAAGIGNDVASTVLKDSSTNANSAWSVSAVLDANTSNNTGTGFGGTGVNGPVGADPFDATGTNRPTIDGLYANYNANGTATITFTGLALNTQYDLSLIGGRAAGGSDGFIKVLTGTAGAGGADIDLIDSDDFLDTFSLLNNGTITSFSVTSDGSGSIALRFFEGQNDTDGGTGAMLNAMSLTQIPEPSAALLGGLGMLALLRRRR